MYVQAKKSRENQGRAVANSVNHTRSKKVNSTLMMNRANGLNPVQNKTVGIVIQRIPVFRKGGNINTVKKPRVNIGEINHIRSYANTNFANGGPDLTLKASAWIEGSQGGLSVNTNQGDPGFGGLRGDVYEANTDSFNGLNMVSSPVEGQPNHHLVRPGGNSSLADVHNKFNGIDWTQL